MTLDQIQSLAIELGWPEEHISFLNKATKPSVDINITADKPHPAASRFGGQPFVPPDFLWPTHETGYYRFLGQFNFDDIRCASTALPASGLLTLFFAEDDGSDVFWQDDGYVIGYYWDHVSDHVLLPTPSGVPVSPEAAVTLASGWNIPRHRELRDDWPVDEVEEVVWDIAQKVNADNYLLGYPSFCSLAYDPTPGPDWLPLLVLSSDEDLDWCWHDGDRLMVFIQAARLQCKDFSVLKCDAG